MPDGKNPKRARKKRELGLRGAVLLLAAVFAVSLTRCLYLRRQIQTLKIEITEAYAHVNVHDPSAMTREDLDRMLEIPDLEREASRLQSSLSAGRGSPESIAVLSGGGLAVLGLERLRKVVRRALGDEQA